jgi:hypothetical protein
MYLHALLLLLLTVLHYNKNLCNVFSFLNIGNNSSLLCCIRESTFTLELYNVKKVLLE